MRGIRICCPVWGAPYVERFTRYLVPCLLAPGNVPALVKTGHKVTVEVHSDRADMELLRQQSSVLRLAKMVHDFVVVNHGDTPDALMECLHPGHHHGGTCMRMCHNFGIENAWRENAAVCFTVADEFIADGWGERILECVDSGKRALAEAGWRIPAAFTATLDAHRRTDGAIVIEPGAASRAVLDLSSAPEFTGHDDVSWTQTWMLPGKRGMLTRAQHIMVHFLYAKHGPIHCNRSVDNDLLDRALDSPDEVMTVRSSAQFFTGGVEGPHGNSAPPKPAVWVEAASIISDREKQAIWLKRACNDWHRHWMHYNWWLEDGTLTEGERLAVEAHADEVVGQTMQCYRALMAGTIRAEVLRAETAMSSWW